MSHGAGGKAHKLIEGLLLPALQNPASLLADAATLPFGDANIALTTDSFVVRPLVFPGGSIGELAVNGTVNDLAVSGRPRSRSQQPSSSRRGLETEALTHEIAMAAAAGNAGVSIVTGDTKVVAAARPTASTSPPPGLELQTRSALVRLSVRVTRFSVPGRWGIMVRLSDARGGLELSDTRPLTPLAALKNSAGQGLRFMRDPTRGGIGTVLNELACDGVALWEGEASHKGRTGPVRSWA